MEVKEIITSLSVLLTEVSALIPQYDTRTEEGHLKFAELSLQIALAHLGRVE